MPHSIHIMNQLWAKEKMTRFSFTRILSFSLFINIRKILFVHKLSSAMILVSTCWCYFVYIFVYIFHIAANRFFLFVFFFLVRKIEQGTIFWIIQQKKYVLRKSLQELVYGSDASEMSLDVREMVNKFIYLNEMRRT